MRALIVLSLIAGAAHADPCAQEKDLTHASIAGCDVEAAAEAKGYSRVSVSSDPSGATVEVDGVTFTTPRDVYLPPGRWTITALVDGTPVAETTVIAKDGASALAKLDVPEAAAPRNGTVDMSDGGGDASAGPPPPVKFKSMLPDRFQKGGVSWVDGPAIVRDPHAHPWRLAAGAMTSPGAIVSLERRFDVAWLWQAGWVTVTPSASFLYDGAAAGRADLTAGFTGTWDSHWWIGGAGGATLRSDRTIGPVATIEVVRDRWSVSARGELHLGALLVGLRF